ncbi:RsmE family RNA methyltransferase [Candidatus Nitronereus thalassa]|uniref:Ribosomal RNA small subunit methyltransferase E n=1 Tax=Candidatus Nitronereus thalassa TaxID=3020898 RepID=A0ABU3K3Y3_9BACT|nr:RsmE family RNA methyltransferase [Candidatus Nitronereus thalassa]MDT7041092.1 RsmE family RNA methyltransferase [Candidatus Nitronereus thalassa]
MPVFFISSHSITNQNVLIEGPLFVHLTKSLRFREGDELIVCDDVRHRHYVKIQSVAKTLLKGQILKTEQGPNPSTARIILGQAMLKGDHMNWAIQKATELGVSTIIPLITERVIVRPRSDRFQSLQERYARIALDAAQQSERWDVPEVLPPTSFHDFLEDNCQSPIKGILVEREKLPGIGSLPLDKELNGVVVVMVGPEGGWTPEEQREAQQRAFTPISMGTSILRGETAPLTALSIIQFRLGNLDWPSAQS